MIEEGRAGSPKMMSVGLHCRLARPGRVAALAEFVEFAKSYKREVWICTREQIADFWIEHHSPRGAGSPVKPTGSNADDDENGGADDDDDETEEGVTRFAEIKKHDDDPSEEGDII